MKVYSVESNKGRILSEDDIHHKSQDGGLANRKAVAKAQRKAVRQAVLQMIEKQLWESTNE